jgi:hypothetical protein
MRDVQPHTHVRGKLHIKEHEKIFTYRTVEPECVREAGNINIETSIGENRLPTSTHTRNMLNHCSSAASPHYFFVITRTLIRLYTFHP